jgi:short-subunit dehydrogenase
LLSNKYGKIMKGNEYALVTGASKGLGKAFALDLASRGINVLLVALYGEGLPELSAHIKNRYGVEVDYLEINLRDPSAVHKIADWASEVDVSILINNAGIGGARPFELAGVEYLDAIISINIRSLVLLTYLLLPNLKKQTKSYILNVASMASFSPMAFKTVYPASKSFVYSFSCCLKEELKNTSVSVSVLHPGPMRTNPEVSKRIETQSYLAKLGIQTPKEVAEIAIRKLIKRKAIIIPGYMNKFNWLLMKIVPKRIGVPIISNIVKREIAARVK